MQAKSGLCAQGRPNNVDQSQPSRTQPPAKAQTLLSSWRLLSLTVRCTAFRFARHQASSCGYKSRKKHAQVSLTNGEAHRASAAPGAGNDLRVNRHHQRPLLGISMRRLKTVARPFQSCPTEPQVEAAPCASNQRLACVTPGSLSDLHTGYNPGLITLFHLETSEPCRQAEGVWYTTAQRITLQLHVPD
jgi:hypothetical protein